jgi:hypothetical protein
VRLFWGIQDLERRICGAASSIRQILPSVRSHWGGRCLAVFATSQTRARQLK